MALNFTVCKDNVIYGENCIFELNILAYPNVCGIYFYVKK